MCSSEEDGYLFLGPRGVYVPRPGPMILDNEGNLVWTETQRWPQAMNVQVQEYKGKSYITFWTGDSTGSVGEGYYLMVGCASSFPRVPLLTIGFSFACSLTNTMTSSKRLRRLVLGMPICTSFE